MNGTFYEQLGGVAGVFEQWGACERTVVACALARMVPWPGLKLLQGAVNAALSEHVNDERLERDANDEILLASLLARDDNDDGADRLRQLLTFLPLLRTDNKRAKDVYVSSTPTLVQRCVEAQHGACADLCRQLLSYLLVHPALTAHDKMTVTQWLRYLENHMSGNTNTDIMWQQRIEPGLLTGSNIWNSSSTFRRTIGKNIELRNIIDSLEHKYTDLLQESFSKNGRDVDISVDGDKVIFDAAISQPKSQRSNSLTPPSTNFAHMSSSAENLCDEQIVQKPRSFSLSSEHSLSQIRPISIMYGTSGSETRLDDLRSSNVVEFPGMSMVAQWLKSLRLHKYVWLFTKISYEQMMAIDDEYLEKLGVTKGARHKLLLSIHKLHERQALLDSMEAELTASPSAAVTARVLERLRAVLVSPMPPEPELPDAIVRVLELASKCLMSGAGWCPGAAEGARLSFDDDYESGVVDPLSLHCWLVEKALHHESFCSSGAVLALKRMRHRLPPRQFFQHVSELPLHRRNKPRWRLPNGYLPKRSWAHATAPPLPRGKSHSYPPFPPAAPRAPPPPPSPGDEYSSLDALCLQMTEQAIN